MGRKTKVMVLFPHTPWHSQSGGGNDQKGMSSRGMATGESVHLPEHQTTYSIRRGSPGYCMADPVTIEIVGYAESECGPFPCDSDRTCGLSACYPTGEFLKAAESLRTYLSGIYGDRITVTVTLLDSGTPARIREIIEARHPPIPLVIVNGRVTPIGRISATRILREIEPLLGPSGDL